MLPFDKEFVLVYILNLLTLGVLLFGLIRTKRRKFFIVNLIVYIVYFLALASTFANGENFRYGGSLPILFYGAIFPLLHLLVLMLIYLFEKFFLWLNGRKMNKS